MKQLTRRRFFAASGGLLASPLLAGAATPLRDPPSPKRVVILGIAPGAIGVGLAGLVLGGAVALVRASVIGGLTAAAGGAALGRWGGAEKRQIPD
jgi:hypothetical protein